jgi:hypothetical protein
LLYDSIPGCPLRNLQIPGSQQRSLIALAAPAQLAEPRAIDLSNSKITERKERKKKIVRVKPKNKFNNK